MEIRVELKNTSCANINQSDFRKITGFLKKTSAQKLEVLILNLECSEGLAEKFSYFYEEIFELKRTLHDLVKKLRVFEINLNNWGYSNARLMPDHCFPRFLSDMYKEMEKIQDLTINLKAIHYNNNVTTSMTLYSLIDTLKLEQLTKLSIDIEEPSNIFA